MTIAGRNGAGKTTLLRMLAGEESIDRGELSLAEGRARGAARPAPTARARRGAARVRAVGLRAGAGARRRSWRSWSRGWGRAAHRGGDARPLRPRAGAAGGARGLPVARPRDRDDAGLGLRRGRPGAPAGHLLRRAADARLAGAGAGDERGRAAAGRAHQPPRHRVAGVAGADAVGPRRRDRAGRPRPLVPGGRRHRRARARGRQIALLRRQLAQLAPRAGRARDRAGQGDRQAAGGDRAHGALHRALPLQGDEGQTGAVAGEEAGEDRADRARPARWAGPGVRVQGAGALRQGDLRADRRAHGGRGCAAARPARARRAVAGARRARLAGGPQRQRQDHADRDARGAAAAGGGAARQRAQRAGRLPLPARGRAGRGRRRRARACSTPRSAPRA